MGVFISAAKIILTVITVVKTVIEIITVEVIGRVLYVLSEVVGAVTLIVKAIIEQSIGVLAEGLKGAVKTIAYVTTGVGIIWTKTITYINNVWNTLKEGYNKFLAVIHFQTLKKIHNIGLLLSSDYRALYIKFWDQIKGLSRALGMADEALPILLRITQQSHQLFSGMIGVGHDIANLSFMKTVSNWQGWEAMKYGFTMPRFSELIAWIDSSGPTNVPIEIKDPFGRPSKSYPRNYNLGISEDIFNGAANVSKVNIGILDGIIGTTDRILKDYMALDKSVSDLQKVVPKDWSDEIERGVKGVRDTVSHFTTEVYSPAIKKLNTVVDYLNNDLGQMKITANDLAAKIAHPGTMLTDIDRLSNLERRIEEQKIAEVAGRALLEEIGPTNKKLDEAQKDISGLYENITTTEKIPPWQGIEKEGVKTPPPGGVKSGKGWNVGDY